MLGCIRFKSIAQVYIAHVQINSSGYIISSVGSCSNDLRDLQQIVGCLHMFNNMQPRYRASTIPVPIVMSASV